MSKLSKISLIISVIGLMIAIPILKRNEGAVDKTNRNKESLVQKKIKNKKYSIEVSRIYHVAEKFPYEYEVHTGDYKIFYLKNTDISFVRKSLGRYRVDIEINDKKQVVKILGKRRL